MKNIVILCMCFLVLVGCSNPNQHEENQHYCGDEGTTCGIDELDLSDYEGFEDHDHVFMESTMQEIITLLEEHENAIVYFGYPKCPWCIDALPIMNTCAKDANRFIYYVRTKDDNGDYLYTKEDEKKLFPYMDKFLNENDKGEKHLFVPFVIVIKDGVVTDAHLGTLDSHDATKRHLNEDEKEELTNIYTDMFTK